MTYILKKNTANKAELFDVSDLATICKCSVRHIYRLCDAGKMPRPVKLGTLVRWSKKTILDWIANDCPPCRREASHESQDN